MSGNDWALSEDAGFVEMKPVTIEGVFSPDVELSRILQPVPGRTVTVEEVDVEKVYNVSWQVRPQWKTNFPRRLKKSWLKIRDGRKLTRREWRRLNRAGMPFTGVESETP